MSEVNLLELDVLQLQIDAWQRRNFPDTTEFELTLGVCEEAGEIAACVLKMARHMRTDSYTPERLRDQIGDIIIFLMGICQLRGWKLSDIIRAVAADVMKRDWRAEQP